MNQLRIDGKFLITDPCYVIPAKDWHTYLDENNDVIYECEHFDIATTTYKGKTILVMKTYWGDGGYNVKMGKVHVGSFSVDSGLFCLYPVDETTDATLGPVLELHGLLSCSSGIAFYNFDVLVDTYGGGEDALEEGLFENDEDEEEDK